MGRFRKVDLRTETEEALRASLAYLAELRLAHSGEGTREGVQALRRAEERLPLPETLSLTQVSEIHSDWNGRGRGGMLPPVHPRLVASLLRFPRLRVVELRCLWDSVRAELRSGSPEAMAGVALRGLLLHPRAPQALLGEIVDSAERRVLGVVLRVAAETGVWQHRRLLPLLLESKWASVGVALLRSAPSGEFIRQYRRVVRRDPERVLEILSARPDEACRMEASDWALLLEDGDVEVRVRALGVWSRVKAAAATHQSSGGGVGQL